MTYITLKRAIPLLLGALILLPAAACESGTGVGDAGTEGDAVIVTPAPATDG